jgi:F-type H+-transporting ATPase subunit c
VPPTASRAGLFIGFAAAELLGLLAFVVAMILIFVA